MTLLDQVAESTHASPDTTKHTPEGRPTLIILDRDGSLHHYPPSRPDDGPRKAQIQLSEDQAQQKILDRILDFTFDVLGISNLEVRVNEHPKR
jgi:hypothetical protein